MTNEDFKEVKQGILGAFILVVIGAFVLAILSVAVKGMMYNESTEEKVRRQVQRIEAQEALDRESAIPVRIVR